MVLLPGPDIPVTFLSSFSTVLLLIFFSLLPSDRQGFEAVVKSTNPISVIWMVPMPVRPKLSGSSAAGRCCQ
jgi:hypothetical protein